MTFRVGGVGGGPGSGAKVYFDFNDWWVGYYRGDAHHYVCLIPTLVIRWSRRR